MVLGFLARPAPVLYSCDSTLCRQHKTGAGSPSLRLLRDFCGLAGDWKQRVGYPVHAPAGTRLLLPTSHQVAK